MKKRFLALVAGFLLLSGIRSAWAQIPVFDSAVFGQAILEVSHLIQEYNLLVQTYQMITNQYNQMLWMAKTLPGNLANFRAIQTPWFLSSATNTYGTTAGWIGAINTGSNVPGGYWSATDPLPVYGAALGNIPADQLSRLENHYATIELTDGANQDGMQTIGTLRFNALQVEGAIQNLEDVSLDSDPDYNTEIGVLNKINAADVIALRNGQDTNKLLTALAEQQFIEAKRQRDSEADAINDDILFMASEQGYLASQKADASEAMMNFRMP